MKRTNVNELVRIGQRLSRSPRRRRRQQAVELIRRSYLFDEQWYLATYPDIERSGVDPIVHYLEFGWKEGRDPGPRFSTSAYLRANADVASLDVNPLLHYVEYGHSEGRGAPEHGAPAPSHVRPREAFGPAAPVASFAVEARAVPRWRRSGERCAREEQGFTLDGYFICRFAGPHAETQLNAALSQLALVSGARGASAPAPEPLDLATLVDAWFTSRNRLRTRWRVADGEVIVVRAIQHPGDAPALVGEGIVVSELDPVEAVLANRMFPLLFVFTTVDGTLIGTKLMAFPSVCRGGLHYPEALLSPFDVIATTESLTGQLLALRDGSRVPLVRSIEVDLAEADGTHPLFQPEVKLWLERVVRVGVRGTSAGVAYLAEAVQATADNTRSNATATLRIGSDMVPAISVLMASADANDRQSGGPTLIVASEDPATPAVLLSLLHAPAQPQPKAFAPAFPSLEGATAPGLLAIRLTGGRALGDAQMLVPVSPPELEVGSNREPVTWLVSTSPARQQDVLQCLESLAAQTGTGPVSIIFVGQPIALADSLARRLFKGRVQAAASFERAARATQTPFVGYIGGNIVLHDNRTSAYLCNTLQDGSVATASVMVVRAETRGKESVIAVADAGKIPHKAPITREGMQQIASSLWRSTWPVAQPPRDLWLTRTSNLLGWFSAPRAAQPPEIHLCSYQLSASSTASLAAAEPEFAPPPADTSALHCELLFG